MLKSLIVAVSDDNIIGQNGSIPWSVPEDMKYFSVTTKNKTVILGRKTWESLPPKFRPLPNRQNIIVSASMVQDPGDLPPDGVVVVDTLDTAWDISGVLGSQEACVIGGKRLYTEALTVVDKVYLTRIHVTCGHGVSFVDGADQYLEAHFNKTTVASGTSAKSGIDYLIETYTRK